MTSPAAPLPAAEPFVTPESRLRRDTATVLASGLNAAAALAAIDVYEGDAARSVPATVPALADFVDTLVALLPYSVTVYQQESLLATLSHAVDSAVDQRLATLRELGAV
jgi:hypothetical protein